VARAAVSLRKRGYTFASLLHMSEFRDGTPSLTFRVSCKSAGARHPSRLNHLIASCRNALGATASACVSSRKGPAPGKWGASIVTPRPRQRRHGMPLRASKERPRHSAHRCLGPGKCGTTPNPRQTKQANVRKLPVPSQKAHASWRQGTAFVPLPRHTSQRGHGSIIPYGAIPIPRQNAQGRVAAASFSIDRRSSS
jgi:hypothetical protein